MEKLHEKILYFQDGKSDKVYKVWIECSVGTGLGLYHVKAAYGRRGGTLTGTNKETSTLRENALYHLNKLIADKKTKGYKENLTEAYSPLNETAATPYQIKALKAAGLIVPPGLTKKQADFMLNQAKQDTYQKAMANLQTKVKTVQIKPIGMLPKKPSTIGVFPHKVEPAPPKEEPPVISGPTGRRIKEID